MSIVVVAGAALLVAGTPLGIVLWRGPTMAALVIYEVLSAITVVVLVLMAEGFGRSGEFELPALMALLLFAGGLVFARALERWL